MSPIVNTDDLIDSKGVAEILGLSQLNSVSMYQHRYPDMPRPVINLGPKRPSLWLRPEIESWTQAFQPRSRPNRRRSRLPQPKQ